LVEGKLIFPKFLDGIDVIQHREVEGKIQFATISKNKAGQYHVSITVSREMPQLSPIDKMVGIDLNVKANVDSDGNADPNPRPAKQYQARLKLLHQRVSRKAKGGKNRSSTLERAETSSGHTRLRLVKFCQQVKIQSSVVWTRIHPNKSLVSKFSIVQSLQLPEQGIKTNRTRMDLLELLGTQ